MRSDFFFLPVFFPSIVSRPVCVGQLNCVVQLFFIFIFSFFSIRFSLTFTRSVQKEISDDVQRRVHGTAASTVQ